MTRVKDTTTIQDTKVRDVVNSKRVINKMTDSSKTSVDVRGVGLAEVTSQKGYIPAIELSVGDSVETVFLDENLQSEKQALKTISNIPDIRSNDNLFVRGNTIYSRSLSFDGNFFPLLGLPCISLLSTSLTILGDSGSILIDNLIRSLSVGIVVLYVYDCVSYSSSEICDIKTNTNYTLTGFTDYKNDELFNQQKVRVVEILLRDDNGLTIETVDGAITWTVKGYVTVTEFSNN